MGTDCKSAAFSFGGSNPPAPTKNSSIRTGYWSFCFSCFAKGEARVDSNSIDPPNSPAGKKAPVQQRRPLPAAETGRSCWGCGQQDARAAQGTMQPLGAATRAPYTARLAQSTRAHQELQYPIQIATRKAKISFFSPQKEVEFFGTENVKSWAPAFSQMLSFAILIFADLPLSFQHSARFVRRMRLFSTF